MMRISALNDSNNSDDDSQGENIQVSKEAQETIAASEYLRALSLKQSGKIDFALSLFEDLLRTNVIYDVPNDDKDNKLFSVKYNCYRNIGLIYEEKKEHQLALKYLVDAINLDDTDVYTLYKVGKLALRLEKFMTAKVSLEKCLERNPNHWGAKDGYLETLCQMELIEAAYGFAFKCYAEDRKYERAIRVLKEIRERFKLSLEFYDGIYGYAPVYDKDCKVEYDPENSVFPVGRDANYPVDTYTVVPDDFKIPEEEISWVTFGKLIHRVYDYTIENKHSLLTFYKWDDWVCKTKEEEPEVPNITNDNESNEKQQKTVEENGEEILNENEAQSDMNDNEKSPESSENPDQESRKSSNRRRCSDLDFLKEWGWHKNRRSTRKKQKEEEETIDTSINGLIRRILPNYFTQTFDTKNSPFIPEIIVDEKSIDGADLDTSKTDAEDEVKFNELTKDSFEKFIDSFKNRDFDLLIPLFEWLRYISLYWNQTIIPAEIIAIYKKIYAIYENCIDYHNMHHMSDDEFTSTFRAAMFYFELLFDEYEETKAEIPDDYIRLKDFLQVNIAFIDDDMDCMRMLVRLLRLTYAIHLHYNNYKDALGFLYKIEEIFDEPKYSEISIDFKNCRHHKSIDFKTVKDLVVKIERKINLASVKKLYETQNYEELVDILLESITYSTGPKVNIDSLTLKIQTQIEVLLECLFSLNRIDECLAYAEKSLYYAVNNFLEAPTEYRLDEWASLVNFSLVYIEAIIKEDGSEMLYNLNDKLPRLVQSLTSIIANQLDSPFDKNNPKIHLINLTLPWIILFPLVQREDDIINALHSKKKAADGNNEAEVEDYGVVANAITMLFSAHELMGHKQWCMKDNGKLWLFLLDNLAPMLRTPMLDPFRDYISENLEQTTYCLYGFPAKKARLRHIEEHDAKNIELTWERAIQLFDLYRPETLPEFDSFKLASISSEMEQLLQRILALIPKCLDIQPFVGEIRSFINGTTTQLPKEMNILPSKISSIYYLLADFYFKNQETGKAVKFFINDLTMKPDRFDSWASISLCKQSKLEMRLNSYSSIDVKSYLDMADQAIICFNQCLKLKKTSTILTEFASFTYHMHSFCSRNLKQASETLSMENFATLEERKEKFLNLSHKCFTEVSQPTFDTNSIKNPDDGDENHDEKWYYSFMLGKIAEKRKEVPSVYLNHYIKSAKYLYEDNATYPIKINHNNPSNLAIESLEVFYRTTACIMKYIELHGKINKPTAKLFMRVLKELASSPFAYNRAKINEDNINALKRKINTTTSSGTGSSDANQSKQKVPKLEQNPAVNKSDENLSEMLLSLTSTVNETENMEVDTVAPLQENVDTKVNETDENQLEAPIQPIIRKIIDNEAGSRRGSQESAMTSTTATTTTHSSSTTSSDSSSDSSDSDSSSSDDEDQDSVFVDEEQINNIYKMCIKNFEECISRFPEHYKSIYRLVYHFLNINESMDKCRQLLLSSNYKTTLGNSVGGLFHERKNNNFFNGIWRIPSQEIDRPGNFTTHLSKCIIILMDVLKKTNDYETLIDLALQLQRNPEADKKYLSDMDKKDLFQQAVACCVQAFKNKLREIMNGIADGKNNDRDLLSLMLEIFKANRKTLKNFQQKDQSLFSGVLVEVYKEYIKDKMILPETANYTDLAFKMCQQEINYRKNLEKGIVTQNPHPIAPLVQPQQQQPQQQNVQPTASPILVKSVSEINKSILGASSSSAPSVSQANVEKSTVTTSTVTSTTTSGGSSARTKPRASTSSKNNASQFNSMYNSLLMTLYSNPAVFTSSYISEYYKMLGIPASSSSATPNLTAQQLALLSDPTLAANFLSSLSGGTTPISPSKLPSSSSSDDLKLFESLMASVASGKGSHLQGLQQNLLSNSLSITTTTITSTTSTSNSNRTSLGSATATTSVSKSQSVSMRKSTGDLNKDSSKKSSKDSNNKINDNLKKMKLLGTSLNLPDLPKSLSITPTIPSGTGMKSSSEKKSKEKSSHSISHSASMASLSKYNLNPSLSITPETYSSSGNRSNVLSTSNMLQSYQEFLKSYPSSQPATTSKKPSAVLNSTSLLKQQKSKTPIQSPASTSSPHQKKSQVANTKIPYDFGKNIASSFSGHSMVSPKPTHSSSPFSQHTPPLTPSPSSIVSPPKTLQQKLAERKQQKTNASKKPDNDDVIVLD